MKKNVFSTLSARAALALAASLLIGLSSCKKEKSGSKPDPVGGGSVTMTTGTAVDGEITLWFAPEDEPAVEGADETESKEEDGWKKNKYTLKAQNLVIKGKVTKLDCSYNTLTSLDVSKNTKLEILYCHRNPLGSLDVSKNTKLTYLNCSYNTLTSLDVSKNAKLEILYCYENQLSSLDMSKNTKLTYLNCSYNLLGSLDVSGNTELKELDCSNNKLTSLDASGSTKLTYLSCYKNNLTFGELKLPELSAKGNLYFKYTDDGDSQTLTKAQVEEIEKNWTVYQYKGSSWVEYRGE